MAEPGLIRGAWGQLRHGMSLVRLKPFDPSTADGRSKERYRRIALTTLSAFVARGVGALTGLIAVPLVLAYLGKGRFGLWSAITTVVSWATLFDFGLANGLVNCLARAHGRDDPEEAARLVATAFYVLLALAMLLLLALGLVAGHVPWHEVLAVRGVVDEHTVMWAVVVALGTFFLAMPLSLVAQIYSAYQRAYIAHAFTMVGAVAGFGALLLALRARASMPVLIVVFGAGSLLASLLAAVYAFRVGMPWLRLRPSAFSREALRALVRRSVPLFLFQVGGLVVNETQTIVLAHRCDLSAVADYSILMRLYLLASGLIQVSTASFVPSFREACERGDHPWMHSSFRHFVRARVILAASSGTGMVLLGNALLRVWLRRSDITFSPIVWTSVAVLMVAATWTSAHSELLSIMDQIWILVLLVFLNGAVTLGLTWWLAPTLQVGGVVLASAAVTVLVYSWLVPAMTRSLLSTQGQKGT